MLRCHTKDISSRRFDKTPQRHRRYRDCVPSVDSHGRQNGPAPAHCLISSPHNLLGERQLRTLRPQKWF